MNGFWAIAGFVLFISLPVMAQTTPSLDPAFCQKLVQHVPDADVAYRPGIDVHGKPVVPADLDDGRPPLLPDTLTIPLNAELSRFLGVDTSTFPFNTLGRSDINLGMLSLREGKVFLNEKPLTSAQQDNLAVLCLKPTSR